jgi:hypothetical protein
MHNNGSSLIVEDCLFFGNVAEYGIGGGGMYNVDSSGAVTGCTFFGNSAGNSGGGMCNNSSSPAVTNCIMWGDTADEGAEVHDAEGGATVITYSDIQGGYSGTGNIDSDPLFVDAEGDDLRLQTGSPCIDTGSNDSVPDEVTTDLDGNPRIVDGNGDDVATVDMGAYEYQP